MIKLILYGAGFIIATLTQAGYAESRYQVEILVFVQGLTTTEVFDQTESRIQWPTALTEIAAFPSAENKMLKDGAAALFKDKRYHQIIHYAWIQSTGASSAILPVHIQSEDGKLDGFIHLKYAQPYELAIDLEQKSDQISADGKPYLHRLNHKRAIKLNEIYYFDHPKLGALVWIDAL